MSARHLPKSRHIHLKNGTLGTALLVTLAFERPPSCESSWVSDQSDTSSPSDAKGLTPANSINLLRGADVASLEDPKGYVPLLLRPESHVDFVDTPAIEAVLNSKAKGHPDQDVQPLLDEKFPNRNFNEHLATWSRELLIGKFQDRKSENESDNSTTRATTKAFQQFAKTLRRISRSQKPEPISDKLYKALLHIPPVQGWLSPRVNYLVQIAQRSLINAETLKESGQLYTPEELGSTTQAQDSTKYAALQQTFLCRVKSLKGAICDDDFTKSRWKLYCDKIHISEDAFGSHGDIHKYFHAAQWLVRYSPPHLFVKHRNEFADLARILTAWVTQWSEETHNEVAAKVSSQLGCLSNALSNLHLTSEDIAACKEVDAYFNSEIYKNLFEATP